MLVVVGLITYPVIFIFGLVALLAATVEWMVQAWSERASADTRFNEAVRGRIAHPLEFPILGAVALGIVIYSFSRIMLFLSKTGGPAVFIVIAALILVGGFLFAYRPSLRGGVIAGVMAIAAVGLVTGGIVAALEGERETEAHETTGDLADDGECDTPDETEADDNASQNVAAKANVTAEIVLESDGTLVARSEGVDEPRHHPGRRPQHSHQRAVPQRERRGAAARARPRHAHRGRRSHRATRCPTPRSRTRSAPRSPRTAAPSS